LSENPVGFPRATECAWCVKGIPILFDHYPLIYISYRYEVTLFSRSFRNMIDRFNNRWE